MKINPVDPDLFYQHASGFCRLIERTKHYGHAELRQLVSELALLYSEASRLILCDLSEVDDDLQPYSIEPAERDMIINRIAKGLHQDYYRTIDPLELYENLQPTMAQLSDDLTDIWQELKIGARTWECGDDGHRRLAQWHWAHSFSSHWGLHAVHAMACVHQMLTRK